MLITSNREYWQLCDRLAKLGPDATVGVDTETTGVALWTKDVLRGVCIGFEGESWYIPVSHPGSWNVQDTSFLRRALEATAALPVYANAQFDWRSLEEGIGYAPPMARYRDVQVIAWLEDENRRKALKFLGEVFLGEDASAEAKYLKALFAGETQAAAYKRLRQELAAAGIKEAAADTKVRAAEASAASKRSWDTISAEDIAAYAAQDAALTLGVYEALLRHPEYAEVEPAVQQLHDVQAAAYRMTRRGVMVDGDRALALAEDAGDGASVIASEFYAEYGAQISSSKQLGALLFDTLGLPVTERTEGGAPSTAAAVLEAMAGDHPAVDQILHHRRLTKAAGFYEGLLDHIDSAGRVHTHFSVVGTVTGRWSSSDPNLQQLPKASTNADAKTLFVAPPDMVLYSFDLKSAELYVGASIVGDEDMMAALSEEGRSFHKETAQGLFGSTEEPYYTLSKNVNYGVPYGIGPRKLAWYLAKGRKEKQTPKHYQEAKIVLDKHRQLWPVLHAGIENCTMYAEVAGRLPLGWPGAFRHFVSAAKDFPVPAYQAFNSAVQGGVARFVNDVLLHIEGPAAMMGAVPVLAVHDSLAFECPIGAEATLAELIQQVSDDLNPWPLRMTWEGKCGL